MVEIPRTPVLPRIDPLPLARIAEPFDDPAFVFELKHDGFRCLAYLQRGKPTRLVSRRGIDYRSSPSCGGLGFVSHAGGSAAAPVAPASTRLLDPHPHVAPPESGPYYWSSTTACCVPTDCTTPPEVCYDSSRAWRLTFSRSQTQNGLPTHFPKTFDVPVRAVRTIGAD